MKNALIIIIGVLVIILGSNLLTPNNLSIAKQQKGNPPAAGSKAIQKAHINGKNEENINKNIPYEEGLDVIKGWVFSAKNPMNKNWKQDKSYVRFAVLRYNSDDIIYVRVPAVVNSPKYTLKKYNEFKAIAKNVGAIPQIVIHSYGPPDPEEKKVAQKGGGFRVTSKKKSSPQDFVSIQRAGGSNDIVVPVSLLSIMSVDEEVITKIK